MNPQVELISALSMPFFRSQRKKKSNLRQSCRNCPQRKGCRDGNRNQLDGKRFGAGPAGRPAGGLGHERSASASTPQAVGRSRSGSGIADRGLSAERLEQLGEALLDFNSLADLSLAETASVGRWPSAAAMPGDGGFLPTAGRTAQTLCEKQGIFLIPPRRFQFRREAQCGDRFTPVCNAAMASSSCPPRRSGLL